jgi:mRNA interferase HicA
VKRVDLLKRAKRAAAKNGHTFTFVRPGGKHDIYVAGGQEVSVPRHREINELTAASILDTVREAKK